VVTLRGLLWLLVSAVILVSGIHWLRDDPRQRAAAVLTAASRLILDSAAMQVDPALMVQSGAEGLTSVLDPYSSYLPPEEYDSFLEETEGEYIGIGVEIASRDGQTVIYNVFPQTPAAEAFVRPGDRITSINGESTSGLRASQVVRKMKGPAGAPVTLTIERAGSRTRTIVLTRRKVAVEVFPVVGITRSGVACIRWTQFTAGSGDRLAAIVEDLLVDRPIGLVLDLRGNPGGILEEAVTAAGVFLPTGTVVCRLSGRGSDRATEFVTTTSPLSYRGPVVVVQDGSTASASEIFIAALHDAGRALTVGRRSFGKGWVQTVTPLGEMGALRLSTARYTTPAGVLVGDPWRARRQYDSTLEGYEPEGGGLIADVVIPDHGIGQWEEALLQAGVFSDFVVANSDEWPAAGVEDSVVLLDALRLWSDSAGIHLEGLGRQLMDHLKVEWNVLGAPARADSLTGLLDRALRRDGELLFSREHRRFLRRLWEERLLMAADLDPGELEALLEFDPDLAVARDLIEQPERYRLMLESSQAKHVATIHAQ
jgi:carboxyl-terminal processing protease